MRSIDLNILLTGILPAVIVGYIAYYFFNRFLKNEENRREFELRREGYKEILPYRIQAIERMTLFLERINPGRLLLRVSPESEAKADYENLLVHTIEEEFEHNLAQQVYLSTEAWEAVRATKNATIALIRHHSRNTDLENADEVRKSILTELIDKPAPSMTGLEYLKNEARDFL